MTLRYLSLCSGIEAASVAWKPLGWEPVAFAEIEPFPCAILSYHYPNVPNLGDMTQIDCARFRGQVDILVAGTPCQAFSVAGARRGLEDERGNLTLKLVEIANAISPAFLVWENVPGVLSMHDNAFGCFLGALAGSDFPAEPAPAEEKAPASAAKAPAPSAAASIDTSDWDFCKRMNLRARHLPCGEREECQGCERIYPLVLEPGDKVCAKCKQVFTPKAPAQKYCSKSCQVEAAKVKCKK